MTDAVLRMLEHAADSPWAYGVLFLFSALDGFLPAFPSESLVITGGVFAARPSSSPNLYLVMLAAGAGAMLGDHISYAIGHFFREHFARKIKGTSRSGKAMAWASRTLDERGGMVLVIGRYIPGGRTAVTLVMGATGYPRKRFTTFDSLAAGSWAIYASLVGFIGGTAFENSPWKGLVTGFAIAVGATLVIEIVRHLRARRGSRPQ